MKDEEGWDYLSLQNPIHWSKEWGPPQWKGTPAARDRVEYWAAGVLAYFDAAGEGLPAHRAERPITTREALRNYDEGLFGLVAETMAYNEHADWRYKH